MKKIIQKILRNSGIQLKKYSESDLKRRINIIKHLGINTLLDIGANTGQYALLMREIGYSNKIISFEPLSSAYKSLKSNSLKDTSWIVNNYAIGHEDTNSEINVSSNSQSSSILNMLPIHLESAPDSKYKAKEEVTVKKLDTIFGSLYDDGDSVMIKIDAQGYEKNVLDGAINSLSKIKIIQLEMSIVSLYEGELLFTDMIKHLNGLGFELFSLENGFANPKTGQLLQVDGVFVRQ